MKILTISIAAYNVEKYLRDTLNSLCDERYVDDIEVLIVDDGSKDNTGSIALEYQEKYPESIKYVAKENGGHGSTINKGMELATGKYFRILDGDDYVEKDAFYAYVNKLKKCSIDVVITDYWWVDDYQKKYPHSHENFNTLTVGKELKYDKTMDSSLFGLSTLSIKSELLKKAAFKITEKCFYVDVEFIAWAIYLSKSFIYYNDKVYMYRCISTTQNSVSKANMLRNVAMQEKVALKLCVLYEKFQKDSQLNDDKKKMILKRITMSIGATYRTFMLYDSLKECKNEIMGFDQKILEKSQEVYLFTNGNRFIATTRKFDFMFLPLIRIVYLFYIKSKINKKR